MASLAILVKYSSLPVISVLPEKAKDFWISTEEEQYKYSLIYNICLAFFTSSIFYCFVEVIPEKLKYKRVISLIQREINQLISSSEVIISLIIAVYKLPEEIDTLTEKDFLIIDSDTKTPLKEISYHQSLFFLNFARKTGYRKYGTLNEIVKSNLNEISKYVQKIKKYEYFYGSNTKFIELLQKIEDCGFLVLYQGLEENDNPLFRFADSAKKVESFVELYRELLSLKLHSEFSVTKLETPEETKMYEEKRSTGTYLKEIAEVQIKQREKVKENPCVIIHGDKYTSQLIVTNLSKELFAIKAKISQIKREDLSIFKHIILVIDSDSYEEMLKIHNGLSDDVNLIILQETNFPLYSVKNKFNKAHNILKFKALTRLFNTSFYFYKNEPSKKTIGSIRKQLETFTNRK